MTYEEAIQWLLGNRSMCNIIPDHPFETWQVRIADADASMMKQAYYVVKAWKERLIDPFDLKVKEDDTDE